MGVVGMKLRNRLHILLRIFLLILLSLILYAQVNLVGGNKRPNTRVFDTIKEEAFDPAAFNRSLPLETGNYNRELVAVATGYLNLPTWSPFYRSCENNSEFSCFELIRAYNTVHTYMKKYENNDLAGYVFVNLDQGLHFGCHLSAVYNGFLIALLTERKLVVTNELWVRPSFDSEVRGQHSSIDLPSNWTFPCEELIKRQEVLEIKGCFWPQVSYIHNDLGPKIRENFGIHAAHYIVNFLVNLSYARNCKLVKNETVVGVTHHDREWGFGEAEFSKRIAKCGYSADVKVIRDTEGNTDASNLCVLKRIINSESVVYLFGSVVGWFGMAMQGRAGAVVDLDGPSCMQLRNSQCGSIIHTYNPRKFFHFVVNNDFLICGPNYNEIRLFMRYMMW
jgi:hypothetical protein